MYETEFPKTENKFLSSAIFQDQSIPLTYKGWQKKANEDITKKDGSVISWKSRVKFCLRYSFPEWAMDEIGEKRLDKNGKPFKNKHYDPAFAHGYSITYLFEEGRLDSGSLPLFEAFCLVRPKPGDLITIRREGKDKETKWTVKKIQAEALQASTKDSEIEFLPSELEPDRDIPF